MYAPCLNMKLLNGKTLEKAMEELQAYKKPSGDRQGNSYYKIEDYTLRMDTVLGRNGYRVIYEEFANTVLPTGQAVLSVKSRIEFLAEDGTVAFFAEGYGTFEIAKNKEKTAFINLSTAGISANVNAFKAACREFSIFGCRSINASREKENKPDGQSSTPSTGSGNGAKTKLPVKTVSFFLKKPLEQFWTDRDGKPAYRMKAQELVNGQCGTGECEILFYPNQYKNDVAKVNELIARSSDTKGFRVTLGVSEVSEGRRNEEYVSSYIFKRFGEGA